MSDKASSDNADAIHDEKNGFHGGETKPGEQLAETGGRRQSVALNVVENPLKVCNCSIPHHATEHKKLTSLLNLACISTPSRCQCSDFRRE